MSVLDLQGLPYVPGLTAGVLGPSNISVNVCEVTAAKRVTPAKESNSPRK